MELKKAQNLIEAYQVFETQQPLRRDQREFYVEIYESDIRKLRKRLLFNPIPNKSFFITGQSGNGKSTTLNFLPDAHLEGKYAVKYLEGRNLFNMDDVDIIDVILMIGFAVVKDDEKLEKRYLEELEQLKNIKIGKLKKELREQESKRDQMGADASLKAKFPFLQLIRFDANIFAKYKMEKETRDSVREIFTLDKLELIQKINQIIGDYDETVLNGQKRLLLIIDDLEKMRDQSQTHALFVDNSYVFDAIETPKLVTFPVHLATRHAMYQDSFKFGIRISDNPLAESGDERVHENRKKLKQVIFRRLDNPDLVKDDAADQAVRYSGGNLRSLLRIMQNAAGNAVDYEQEDSQTSPITSRDVELAVQELSELPALSVMKRVKALKYVMDHNQEPQDKELEKDFVSSVLDNSVFAYFNGHPWYDLNPIIKESVRIYAKRAENR